MTSPPAPKKLRVAIAGFGAIGGALAARLDQGIAGLRLVAVSARDADKARAIIEKFLEEGGETQ